MEVCTIGGDCLLKLQSDNRFEANMSVFYFLCIIVGKNVLFGGNTLKYVGQIKCCINTTKYDNYVVLKNCIVRLGVFSHIFKILGIRHRIPTYEYVFM